MFDDKLNNTICHQTTSRQNVSLCNSSAHYVMHGWQIAFFQFSKARLSPQIKQINNTICQVVNRQYHVKTYLCVILRPIMSCTDDKSRSSSLNVIWFWRFVKCVFVPCLSHLLVPTMRLSRHRELGIVKIKYYIEPLVSLCIMFLHLGLRIK